MIEFKLNAAHLIFVFCTALLASLGRLVAKRAWRWMQGIAETFAKIKAACEAYEGIAVKSEVSYRVVKQKFPEETKRTFRECFLGRKAAKAHAAAAGGNGDEN